MNEDKDMGECKNSWKFAIQRWNCLDAQVVADDS
jgi:hypothetical protein